MQIVDITDSHTISEKNILVDANILMFIDGVVSYDDRSKKYSNAYFDLKKRNTLYVTEKCLDEFNNRLTKLYYDIDKASDSSIASFKKHRKTNDFLTCMECIYDATISFIQDMNVIKNYDFLDCEKAFHNVSSGFIDFSDIVSARICIKEDMLFFTDDADAIYCKDLNIITGNPWIIHKSSDRVGLACL